MGVKVLRDQLVLGLLDLLNRRHQDFRGFWAELRLVAVCLVVLELVLRIVLSTRNYLVNLIVDHDEAVRQLLTHVG